MENRSRVIHKKDKSVADFRKSVSQIADDGVKAAILKDRHLSEAAIVQGFGVLSLDDKQQSYLASIADTGYAAAGRIAWVNPSTHEDCADWLLTGCSPSYEVSCVQVRELRNAQRR